MAPRLPRLLAALLCWWCWGCDGSAEQGSTTATSAAATGSAVTAAAAGSATATASATASAAARREPPIFMPQLRDEGPFRTIDLHVDTPYQVKFKKRSSRLKTGHVTPETLRKGAYAGLTFAIYIPDYLHKNKPTIKDAEEIYDTVDALVEKHELLTYALDRKAVKADSVSVFVAIEGAGAFAEDITQIDRFIKRGVRLVGLVHMHDNKLASSVADKGQKRFGLTDLGKDFCRRVYQAGALVDASHMSDAAFADLVPIAKAAGAPLVASHSNARAVREHPRNLTDEQLRLIGETGGVAGINLYRPYIRKGKPKLSHVVEHALHMIAKAGIDHVAIGSDFDGGQPVYALRDASHLPELAQALKEKGLSDGDVRKIFSHNALRVLSWGLK